VPRLPRHTRAGGTLRRLSLPGHPPEASTRHPGQEAFAYCRLLSPYYSRHATAMDRSLPCSVMAPYPVSRPARHTGRLKSYARPRDLRVGCSAYY
jgi:hypothetical protein